MGAGPALRLAHTAVFAAVCVAVSGLGHALSSGAALSPSALALAFVLMCGAGWQVTYGEHRAPVIIGASALGQLALHALFGLLHPAPPASPRTAGHGHALHHGLHGPAETAGDVMAAMSSSNGTTMAGAHVVAGMLCGWWLWRGEAAAVQLARSLALFVGTSLHTAWRMLSGAAPLPRAAWLPAPRRRASRRPTALLVLYAVTRRGPPSLPS
ncbi:hypothetical protein ABZ070_14825 [Streptomyces sp. NPDC006283]|uniref:hypothetical protein n=1 Tax=Streptomyces sp. NPDC006283 TaxID=3156741 RepID=UPI0033ACF082